MEKLNYKWITVKEIVELVLSDKFENSGSLDFTLDSYEWNHDDPNFEPTGWYGIARTKLFDGDAVVIGYHGGGIEMVVNCLHLKDYIQETFEDVLITFLAFLNGESSDYIDGKNCDYTETSMICIDENYPNEY